MSAIGAMELDGAEAQDESRVRRNEELKGEVTHEATGCRCCQCRCSNPGQAHALAKLGNQVRVQAASIPWGGRGARINSISPGVIATPMGRDALDREYGKAMRQMVISSGTGRVGTSADIAHAADLLLGPASSFITGTDLGVDGE